MVFARHNTTDSYSILALGVYGALIKKQCSIAISSTHKILMIAYILITNTHAAATSNLSLLFLFHREHFRHYSIFIQDNKNTIILELTFLNTSEIFAEPLPTLYFTFANVRHYYYFAIRKSQLFHKHYI